MSGDAEYVVLSETSNLHLVCIRRPDQPWLRVVGAFHDRARADSYAEVENMSLADDVAQQWEPSWQHELNDTPPTTEQPASTLAKLLSRSAPSSEEITQKPQEPADEPSAPEPESIIPEEPPAEPEEADEAPAGEETPDDPETDDDEPSLTATEKLVMELWPDPSVPVGEIARRAGCSGPTVYNTRRRLGLPDRSAYYDEPETPEPEEQPAPEETNGTHLDLHGVSVCLEEDEETITFGDRAMDVTTNEAKMVAMMLKAAPKPVSVATIQREVYGEGATAEYNLGTALKDLRNGLAGIGLELIAGEGELTIGGLHVDA